MVPAPPIVCLESKQKTSVRDYCFYCADNPIVSLENVEGFVYRKTKFERTRIIGNSY